MKHARKIRYAVVGMGHLSQFAILPAFAHSRHAELGVLISGDVKKSEALSRKYRTPVYSYDAFEGALKSHEIDAAFIVLPNHMHREFTERAATAGVHVLCEKPMAVTATDCQAMIRACERARVKLMIAYRLHFTESQMRAVEMAHSGTIGELRLFSSVFAMQVEKGNIRTKAATGGGPLLDIGVYCINAARYLFRDDPVEVSAMAATSDDPRFTQIDEMVSAVLRFPKDRLASFSCSFGAHDISEFNLLGTKGILHSGPAYDYSVPIQWTVKGTGKTITTKFPKSDQFAAEMDYFAECIQKNRQPEPSGVEGLMDVRIIEAINESLKKGRAVKIRLPKKAQRAGPQLIVKRPTVKRKTRLVKAHAPHR